MDVGFFMFNLCEFHSSAGGTETGSTKSIADDVEDDNEKDGEECCEPVMTRLAQPIDWRFQAVAIVAVFKFIIPD